MFFSSFFALFKYDISLNARRPLGGPEVQAAPPPTSKIESFATIAAKLSTLDVCEGPTYASDVFSEASDNNSEAFEGASKK